MISRFAILIAFATWIWWRSWRDGAGEGGEIWGLLLAFPLAWSLGRPWRMNDSSRTVEGIGGAGLVGFLLAGLAGVAWDSIALLAGAWAFLFARWVAPLSSVVRDRAEALQLASVAAMGFPWVVQDFGFLGWWFRLSGAAVVESLFGAIGFAVEREGTSLLVETVPIEVEAACSGLNSLQVLLLAGSFVNFLYHRGEKIFWGNLLLLVVLAWVANTLRICLLSGAALTWGSDFARGSFHETSGLMVVGVMLALSWGLMAWQRNRREGRRKGQEIESSSPS